MLSGLVRLRPPGADDVSRAAGSIVRLPQFGALVELVVHVASSRVVLPQRCRWRLADKLDRVAALADHAAVTIVRRKLAHDDQADIAAEPVPKVGIEPTRPEGHRILSPARLPVPPLRPASS
jgi:hypothetical protein